ncbi:MAG: polyphosphate polymerase domain-containing protein [Clostridia bacterium]|nr:polyphosphate polymerase domain-containing protein [Clostridia bacterium]
MEEKITRLPERHEKKYWINPKDMAVLRSRLSRVLSRDSHADKDGNYFIRSLYFDDAFNSAYYDKMDGVAHRDKYRIRIYSLTEDVTYLERKRKEGNLIQKSACRISRKLAQQLIEGNPSPLLRYDDPLLLDMYAEMRNHLLRAKTIVDYTREAFVGRVENVRVTFDKHLATCPGSTDLYSSRLLTLSPLDDGRQILEVKYDRYLPDFVAAILYDTPTEYCAISKYVLCRRFEPLA